MKIKKNDKPNPFKKIDPEIEKIHVVLKTIFTDIINLAKTIDLMYKKDKKFFDEYKKMNDKFLEMLEELKRLAHSHEETK